MDRFRADNTDGYTQADLDELNRLFRAECRKQGLILENDDMWTRSAADNVAEHVQAAYDTARHLSSIPKERPGVTWLAVL